MPSLRRTGQPIPGDKHWMTLQEAAVYIATSVKTVRRRIASGDLRPTSAVSAGCEYSARTSTT